MIDSYLRLGNLLENSPYYHYSFAAALNKMALYRESIDQLVKCELQLSNYSIQMLYANNYLKLNEFEKAETHLLKANAMCPKKFMPSYLLVYAYDSMKLNDRARYFAKSLVSKTVKIPSSTVEKIIDDMKIYLAKGYFAKDSLIEVFQANQ